MNKIPKCPNCNIQMRPVWYHDPTNHLEKYIKQFNIYYRGFAYKNEDIHNPERIIFHCFNCNRSYSKNLKKYVVENNMEEILKEAKQEIDRLVNEIAKNIINDLDEAAKTKLKKHPPYNHFGIGLYIRNNYVYNNKKIKYKVDADDLSSKVYYRILDILTN